MTMPTQNHVDLPAFDGPLALLVELIERNKLEVTSISVDTITKEYLDKVSSIQEIDTNQLAEFVQLGSRLVYIKSLALLPGKTEQDEELALLEQDLTEYRRYREAAETLQNRLRTFRTWPKGAEYEAPAGRIRSEVSLEQLSAAFSLALARKEPLRPTATLKRHLDIKVISKQILHKTLKGPIHLQSLIDSCSDRLEIIVTFLALLEVIKTNQVSIQQTDQFGQITISAGGRS